MSDQDPTMQEEGAVAAPPPAAAPPTPAPAMAAAGATTGAGSPAAASAATARWNAIGANGQLVVIGAGIALASYLLGMLLAQWSLGLSHVLLIVAAVAAIGVVVAGASAVPARVRTITLRVSAGIAAAYAAVDVGDMIDGLSSWSALDIAFTLTTAIGAAILLVGAWRLTDGDPLRDVSSLARPAGRSLADRLILLGGLGVIAGWVLLRMDGFVFRDQDVLQVLLVVLAAAAVWLAAGGAGDIRWPVPASIVIVALSAAVGLLALIWVGRVVDELDEFTIVSWVSAIVHVGAAAAMVAGAALKLQPQRTTPSAPPAG
jgi:hypothetical protein